LPAGGAARVEDHRPDGFLGQPLLDLPNQLLALFLVGLHRLLIDQLVDLRAAIPAIVPLGAAHVILVKGLVRIVDPGLGDLEPHREVLAHHLGVPLGGVDDFELRVDIDLLQL
jgi:hypothetical protein